MTVSVADIERWRPGDVREVFHATRSRAEAAFEAADGISTLPVFGTWGGVAADAAKDASEKLRKDLDAHGNEALAVSKAAQTAADDMQRVKDDLAALKADAEKGGYQIDPATSRIVPGPNVKAPLAIAISEMAALQTRLGTILANAVRVDQELAAAINMATGKSPIPAMPAPSAPINQQAGEQPPGAANGNPFLDQWQNELTRGAPTLPADPRAAAGAPSSLPALDPNDPQVKAMTDFMRADLARRGFTPEQADAQIASMLARAQQPLPASAPQPPKPQPGVPQPEPSIGEQLGAAFNDFTNNVHEGFYDRAGETLNMVQNLTGTGGEGHPGVADAWKDLVLGNAKQALTDPTSVLLPGSPMSALTNAARELPEAIDNPGHYVGEKFFDGTLMAATAPLGGEGALSRALLPEVRALDGALPEAGGLAAPGIPHHVADVPPVSSPGVGHDLPPAIDHSPPTGHLPPTGDPGAFGYDMDGNRLPYANGRPSFAPGQVPDVWNLSRDAQVNAIDGGMIDLPMPGPIEQWVQLHPNGPVGDDWIVDNGHRLIEWQPGDPRRGLWDMGHVDGQEYWRYRQQYLNGEMSFLDFMQAYRDPSNYSVQDPFRNRSHIDEQP